MGRKIPGKKHHGVKDPAVQQLRRELSLKDKINAPPTRVDFQEVPSRVLEIARLKQLARRPKVRTINKKKPRRDKRNSNLLDLKRMNAAGPKLPGMNQHDKDLSLTQRPRESESAFIRRIENATSDLIGEIKMEAKHNIKVNTNDLGESKIEKVEQFEEITKRRIRKSVQDFHKGITSDGKTTKKEKRDMKKMMMRSTNQPTERSQKRRIGKKQRKKMKQAPKKMEEEMEGIERRYETVKFGEVVHEPPHIKRRPRGVDPASKPRVDGLVLTKMLNPSTPGVSMASKKRLEEQRLAVVQAYRDLKAAKRNSNLTIK